MAEKKQNNDMNSPDANNSPSFMDNKKDRYKRQKKEGGLLKKKDSGSPKNSESPKWTRGSKVAFWIFFFIIAAMLYKHVIFPGNNYQRLKYK